MTERYEQGFAEGKVREYPSDSGFAVPVVADVIADRVGLGTVLDLAEKQADKAVYDDGPSKPNTPILQRVDEAAAGWQGTALGLLTVAGSLLLNPDFSAKLGSFTVALAKGDGSWGALAALVGAALIAYRKVRHT